MYIPCHRFVYNLTRSTCCDKIAGWCAGIRKVRAVYLLPGNRPPQSKGWWRRKWLKERERNSRRVTTVERFVTWETFKPTNFWLPSISSAVDDQTGWVEQARVGGKWVMMKEGNSTPKVRLLVLGMLLYFADRQHLCRTELPLLLLSMLSLFTHTLVLLISWPRHTYIYMHLYIYIYVCIPSQGPTTAITCYHIIIT